MKKLMTLYLVSPQLREKIEGILYVHELKTRKLARIERWIRIVEGRKAGLTWKEIGKREGKSGGFMNCEYEYANRAVDLWKEKRQIP